MTVIDLTKQKLQIQKRVQHLDGLLTRITKLNQMLSTELENHPKSFEISQIEKELSATVETLLLHKRKLNEASADRKDAFQNFKALTKILVILFTIAAGASIFASLGFNGRLLSNFWISGSLNAALIIIALFLIIICLEFFIRNRFLIIKEEIWTESTSSEMRNIKKIIGMGIDMESVQHLQYPLIRYWANELRNREIYILQQIVKLHFLYSFLNNVDETFNFFENHSDLLMGLDIGHIHLPYKDNISFE